MIALDRITKSYNGRPALRGVTTDVDRGEFVYLTGPSGAGKSTFLRLLYRAELPDSGAISVNGADLTTMRRREVAEFRRRLGVVFQDFKLLRRRTIGENVTFVLSLLNIPDREQQRRAYVVLKQMGLQHRIHAYPGGLSGGEQQRVAIARALALQPDVILADEPSGNLDPERSHELLELLKTINYQGTTVVVATHDRTLIEAHPARTLFLDHGRVARDAWVDGAMNRHAWREIRRQLKESGAAGFVAVVLVAVASAWGGVLWTAHDLDRHRDPGGRPPGDGRRGRPRQRRDGGATRRDPCTRSRRQDLGTRPARGAGGARGLVSGSYPPCS